MAIQFKSSTGFDYVSAATPLPVTIAGGGSSQITTVGALTSGSIASGFGSINIGSNALTAGAISGTTGTLTGDLSTTDTGAILLKLGRLASTPSNGLNAYIGVQWTGGPGAQNGDLIYIPRTTSAGNMGHRFFTETAGTPVQRLLIDASGLTVTGLSLTTGNDAVNFSGSSVYGYSALDSTDTSGAGFIAFRRANAAIIGSITRVTTTDAVAYNTTSDARLKTNVRDFTAEDAGRIIDGLKPRWFDWKASDLTETVEEEVVTDKQDEDGKPVMEKRSKQRKVTDAARIAAHVENNKSIIGFIAQEEAAVDPALVRIGAVTPGDDDPTTITKQWSRSDAALVPVLVAEVKSLRARVATLEQESKRLDALEARIEALEKK